MFLKSIHLRNILSFGPDTKPLELKNLNVLIGPNGVGKSNLIDAISVLQAAPKKLAKPIREGGGVTEWLWKYANGKPADEATLQVVAVHSAERKLDVKYFLAFAGAQQFFDLICEDVEDCRPSSARKRRTFHYEHSDGEIRISIGEEPAEVVHSSDEMGAGHSLLAQLKDAKRHPELTRLGISLGNIRIYREWAMGRKSLIRQPQRVDAPREHLEEDCSNLHLMISRYANDPSVKRRFLEALRKLYDGIDDFAVEIVGSTTQVFLHEGDRSIPAIRLSDGTFRYLCLLAILLDPTPPPLICIEEPELGLHPDLLPTICDLMTEASERTQLIVTTHSDIIVDALSDQPESVVVCEKENGSTVMRRLDPERMKVWLEKYSLGRLWTDGELGGNRW